LILFGFIIRALGEELTPAPGSTKLPITAVIALKEGAILYQKPVDTSEPAGQLFQGTIVTVDTLGIYWCRVTSGKLTGFLPTAALFLDDWDTFDPERTAISQTPRLAVFNVGMSTGGNWSMTLRDKASRKGAKMDTCIAGSVMVVLVKGKEYSLVHIGGKVGYLLTKYLTFFSEAQVPQNYAVVNSKDKVNLRFDRRFGDSGIISILPPGTVVTLIWEKKGWACVEVDGYQGYVVSEFLVSWLDSKS